MSTPRDAKYIHEGLHYKLGVHNKVFMWVGGEWRKSEKSWSNIVKDVEAEAKRLANKKIKATRQANKGNIAVQNTCKCNAQGYQPTDMWRSVNSNQKKGNI